jgi:hypothetical protein
MKEEMTMIMEADKEDLAMKNMDHNQVQALGEKSLNFNHLIRVNNHQERICHRPKMWQSLVDSLIYVIIIIYHLIQI